MMDKEKATGILTEFRDRCYRLYFAFGDIGISSRLLLEHYQRSFQPEYRHAPFGLGVETGTDPNLIELETVALMTQGELIEVLQPDGEFENLNRQAFIVLVYHLWDEYYRPRIAEALCVETCRVRSDLMGDLRLVRNAIIHNKAELSDSHLKRLKVLPNIWNIGPSNLQLTTDMMNLLSVQLGSVEVYVPSKCPLQ